MRKLQVIVGGVQLLDYCDCIVHSCMAGLLTSTMAYDFVLFVVVVGFSSFHVVFFTTTTCMLAVWSRLHLRTSPLLT